MNRKFPSKLKLLAMALPIVSNLENATAARSGYSEIRPLLTQEQLFNLDAVAEKFLNQLRSNLDELNPENLNKKLNNGNDLFDLDTIVANKEKSRKEGLNSAIEYVWKTSQKIGKGVYDFALFKTKELLKEVNDGKFFDKNDKKGNYNKLMKGIKSIFAPTEIDDRHAIFSDGSSEDADSSERVRYTFNDEELINAFSDGNKPN